MADINQQTQELAELMERVNDELRRFGKVTEETADALKAGSAGRAQELKTAGKLTADALGSVASAAGKMGSAMLQGEKGAAAFNSSLDSMAEAATAAGAALTFLIPGGPLIKGLVAGFTAATAAITSYAKAANEMSDKLYKGFNGLAKSGAAASDGMSGVFRDAKKLGLSMNELDGFVQMVGENSKDLALFGGTVFEGRKKFADMGKAMEPFRESLMNAGLTQEQINKGAMGYLRLQTRIGLAQTQTTEQLAEGARKYLVEQDALTKLTGMSREDAESAREEIRSQERFAGKLEELRQKGKLKEAQELENAYLIIRSQNKEAAQGFADVSTGMINTEAAQKSFMASQGKNMEISQRVQAGQLKAAEAAQKVFKAHGETAKGVGVVLAQQGTYSKVYGDYAADIRSAAMSQQDLQEVYEKIVKDQEKQGIKGGQAGDKLLQDRTKLILTQQGANKVMEEFVFKGIEPAQAAMIKLAEATTAGAAGLSKMFGGTEYSDSTGAGGFEVTQNAAMVEAGPKTESQMSKDKELYNSPEFKAWQKEKGAGFLTSGMYSSKYGVDVYREEKGIKEEPVKRAKGSLGTVGKLIEDFGPGTPAILHGREGVVTEDQLRKFGEQALALGQQNSVPQMPQTGGYNAVLGQPSDKIKEYVSNTTDTLEKQLDVEEETLKLKEEQQELAKKQVELKQESAKKEDKYAREELTEYKRYIDRKDRMYHNILDAIESQFKIVTQATGSMTSAAGATASGGGGGGAGAAIASFFSGGAQPGVTGGPGPATAGTAGGPGVLGGSVGGSAADMGGPLVSGPPQPGIIGKLLDYIGKHESAGNYNILVGGKTNPDLTNMTVGEVLEFQKQMLAQGHESTAVGKYQIIKSTLSGLVKQGFANLDDKFDASTQDKLAVGLLKRRGLDDYMAGKLDANKFADKLSMEWASLPYHTGASYYAGVGSNRSGDSREKFMTSVFAKDGGVFNGPMSGYPATLHGNEAVIPLKDGNVPAEIPKMDALLEQNNAVKEEIVTMRTEMKQLLADLTTAINESKESGTQERMISILETIARYQSNTADTSRKMLQQAAN